MIALFSAELLKLRTTRTFAVLVGCAVGLALLITGLVAAFEDGFDVSEQRDMMRGDTSSFFIFVLAVVGMAGEWRHRTLAGALLAAPDRLRFFAAKVAAYAAAGVALSLAVSVSSYLLMIVILAADGSDVLQVGDFAEVTWKNLVIAAYYGALGVAFGALVRNQAGAIVTVLVILFVVEPVILAFFPDAGRFGPFIGAPSGFTNDGIDDTDVLSAGVAFLVMLGWVAVLCGGAAALFRRRDIV